MSINVVHEVMKKKEHFVLIVIAAVSITLGACGRTSGRSASTSNSSAQQTAVVDELRKLAETQCGTRAEAIDPDTALETQGCDDLDVVELIMTVEEKYNLSIPDDQIDRVTINKLARIVNNR
jgi:acyl carrier protein